MARKVKIHKYDSLESCFASFRGKDTLDSSDLAGFWVGKNGRSSYKVNVGRWLKNTKRKAWGWAEYKTQSIHLWAAKDCPLKEAMRLIAHELGHLRKPRPGGMEEEKKAARYANVTGLSYDIAQDFLR